MKTKAKYRQPVVGTQQVFIQIPTVLHATMKDIKKIRHELEGADPKLCRIYKEAVEQYVNAEPQQRLLSGRRRAERRRTRKLIINDEAIQIAG